ncbi:MAG: hypothetical protein A4E72_01264 [Syntrophus sp. PtaU1.Bin208]|nr:MAG: hypothetical protein A4E72_01264 [Syntrophus sp. PtaU1.Bin208]
MTNVVTNSLDLSVSVVVDNQNIAIEYRNHFELIRFLLQLSDAAFFVSPFLYEDFSSFFAGLNLRGMEIELVTSCAPRGTDQLKKPFSLRSFGSLAEASTGNWPTIGVDQALHSKIYVFFKGGMPFAGIITSANLTGRGLQINHEAGVLLRDKTMLLQLVGGVQANLDYVNISKYQVDQLCTAATIMSREVSAAKDYEIGLKNILNNFCTPSAGNRGVRIRESAEYYIKVSGVTDKPILAEDQRPFDEPHCELSFAKSPDNIRLGDCLLQVAVGGMCFLSYYACASPVFERSAKEKDSDPDYKRWPYYVFANNLSLNYGRDWFKKPLYYNDVIKRFKAKYPSISVTKAGKDHFIGAIQLGHSYIRVTSEFGKFVRHEIDNFKC